MKLALFLTLFMTFSYVQSSYNLLAFGDIGQIDIFKKRNPGKLFKSQQKKKAPASRALSAVENLLKEEQFIFKGNKCVMKVKGKKVNRMKEGYSNFRKILCAASRYIKRSDQITILGDMVYAENKGLTVNHHNLLNERVQRHMEKRTLCGFKWFRDMMENYKRYCPRGSSAVHRKLWSSRSRRLHQRFYIIEGNHAFDVNYSNVSALIAGISQARAYYVGSKSKRQRHIRKNDLHLYPRFKRFRKNGVRIEFLDLNTHIFGLLLDGAKGVIRKEPEYKKFAQKVLNQSKIMAYRDALNYLKYTHRAIRKFSSKAHWRVIRSHHPPMNIEGGFNEQSQIWTVKYRGKSIMDLLREKKVKLWLASHHHSGHVMVFPFNQFHNLTKKKFSALKTHVKNHCIYHSPSAFTKNAKTSKYHTGCPSKAPHYKLQDNFNSNKSGYLWIFVTGNSGRELDEMEGSHNTRASLIWGRAVPHHYGAMNINFSARKFKASFIEADKSGKSHVVASFRVRNTGRGKHAYNFVDHEVTSKLK
jgi:hypothetical protein